jgi:hypothetical protein
MSLCENAAQQKPLDTGQAPVARLIGRPLLCHIGEHLRRIPVTGHCLDLAISLHLGGGPHEDLVRDPFEADEVLACTALDLLPVRVKVGKRASEHEP